MYLAATVEPARRSLQEQSKVPQLTREQVLVQAGLRSGEYHHIWSENLGGEKAEKKTREYWRGLKTEREMLKDSLNKTHTAPVPACLLAIWRVIRRDVCIHLL